MHTFYLTIRESGWVIDLCGYDLILGQIPQLKKVVLDITNEFVDKDDVDNCETILPLAKDLTIQTTVDAKFQSLLDSFYLMLPNLKRLAFFYYSGTFEKSMSEFRIQLPNYSIEFLHLDCMSPVETKSIDNLKRKADGFFVLKVDVLKTRERHLYKFSFDLKSVLKIDYGDLKGFIRDEDYYLVRVTIRSAQNLELFANVKVGDKDHYSIVIIHRS